ncbi:salivary peroxidase/catechol oxidase isoform X2 [Parasteatoda tepidariorum]|nr:peroxidase isoform X3 [Parasteatoda tepidariorum]XP_042906530.1 peroxidase isoform X3 [Parasteatoda tepidariorum]
MRMFFVHGNDEITTIEEASENTPLIAPSAPTYPRVKPNSWRRYIEVDIKVPRIQTITGILLGLLLLGMIVMLVAEAIRENRQPDPFLVDYSTSPSPFAGFLRLPNKAFHQAWVEGEGIAAYRRNLEKVLFENGILPKRGSPSSTLQKFQKGNVDVQELEDCGLIVEHMKKALGGCIDVAMLPDHCQPDTPTSCSSTYPYRTLNGSCNNLQHADWGMAMTAFKRLLRPDYADGVSQPRMSVTGDELPNARYLSNKLYTHRSRPKCNATVLIIYFGLFVDHDVISIVSKQGHNGAPISCCHPDIIENPSLMHPECMAISVPEDDTFYRPLGVKCLDFLRSIPVPGECPGEREQMNLVTSFLDASGVYSSFYDKSNFLRSHKDGQLRVCNINNTEMLPPAHHLSYQCGFPKQNQYCFQAGDMRANEQVELTAIHAIWMREHNRIAERFHSLNPHWSDEKLFQESRRLVIAELQHIVYNEFLPLLLGEEVANDYNLIIDPQRGFEYNTAVNPSMFNVFGASAFRVGHSLIEGMLDLIGPKFSSMRQIPLHTAFLNPHIFYEKGIDLLLRGLVREKAASADSYITDEVRNRLFQPHTGNHGMDLAAIGIQRGRDQGLPSYPKWRKFCNLSEVNTWEDLFQAMDSEHVQRLRNVYSSVDDIDLTPAALSENHLPGALVGPTHACLIARQFQHTRYGDRFWFEAKNQVGSFTPSQLAEIYKSSVARLFCDNSDKIVEIQAEAFRVISDENPVLPCSEIAKVDLKLWME